MKISVDGAGLCSENRFGNYIFSQNLIQALSDYDRENSYNIYSFCPKPKTLKLKSNFNYQQLHPRKLWLSVRISLEEKMHPSDIFLALNQAIPLYSKAKIIAFSHGLSFFKFPQFYKKDYPRLKKQLDGMLRRADIIVVSSRKVKNEFTEINRSIGTKIKVIPFGIPLDMVEPSFARVNNVATAGKYFLYVGMEHPIKNIEFLRTAVKQFPGYKLHIAEKDDRSKLKELYQHATAYLTASHYESFNLPVLEALSQNCPVVGLKSAIIPELKLYTYTANNFEDFVAGMKLAIYGKLEKIDRNRIINEFSWKKYVTELQKLY